MMTLRTKVLSALLLSSLGAILVIALITPPLLEYRFVGQASATHFGHFTRLIQRYQNLPDALPWGTRAAALDFYQRIVTLDRRRHEQRALEQRPPRRPPRGMSPAGNPPRPGGSSPFESTDMRFVLADTQGYVIPPFYDYQAGQQLSLFERWRAAPLTFNGELVGYALATGEAPQTPLDDSYRTLLYQSLAVAGAIALLLSLLVAALLTRPMLRQLRQLSRAVNELEPGQPFTPVVVSGTDEIATLAKAFNRMSGELTDKYRALQASNETIARQAKSLERLSYTDELTGLHNRRYFNEQFAHWFEICTQRQRALALVIVDVDHFKRINDGFSHQVGDLVLQQIAHLMRQSVRTQDILARFGGEELILLMPDASVQTAKEIAERMRLQIEQHPWQQIAEGLRVTASFGITGLQHSQHDMLKRADEQLYRAKDSGRNSVCIEV